MGVEGRHIFVAPIFEQKQKRVELTKTQEKNVAAIFRLAYKAALVDMIERTGDKEVHNTALDLLKENKDVEWTRIKENLLTKTNSV